MLVDSGECLALERLRRLHDIASDRLSDRRYIDYSILDFQNIEVDGKIECICKPEAYSLFRICGMLYIKRKTLTLSEEVPTREQYS